MPNSAPAAEQRLYLHTSRLEPSDLEISGLVKGLAPGAVAYVRYTELAGLALKTIVVRDDENFPVDPQGVRITGIDLEVLARAVGALPTSDLIEARCSDKYRSHYPAQYIAAHEPVLGFKVEGEAPDAWARHSKQIGTGNYFISHADFKPAFRVLSHADEPQVPTGIIRIHFNSIKAMNDAIGPVQSAADPAVADGYVIARQNCLRCHNKGEYGGTKAGVDWQLLSMLARQQPDFFERYVRAPRSLTLAATMPANPLYDDATLHALSAYFRTFADVHVRP